MRLAVFFTGIILMMLMACNKSVAYIGATAPSDNPYLLQLDTFDAQAIIYRPDSIRSSGTGVIFTGIQKDPTLGVMQMTPYFRVSLPSLTPQIDNASYYDSIILKIHPNKTYYGDTNSIFKINVDRLSEDMTNYNGDIFFNNNSFSIYPESLGSTSVRYRPNIDGSIVIRLDDAFGKQLFDMFKSNALTVIDTALFKTFLKGIRLTPDAADNVIYSLPVTDSLVQMQLLYHQDVGTPVAKQVNFGINTGTYYFTNIAVDRSSTPLYELDTKTEISSTEIIVNDEMTQTRTRLNFPGIANVQKLGSYVKILQATLEIKPVTSRYSSFYKLPPSLNLYTYDIAGLLGGPLTVPGSSTTSQTGSLYVDNVYGRDTKYSFDITNYINNQLTASTYTTKQLVVITPGINTRITNLVAGLPSNTEFRTRLILSLLLYNEKH